MKKTHSLFLVIGLIGLLIFGCATKRSFKLAVPSKKPKTAGKDQILLINEIKDKRPEPEKEYKDLDAILKNDPVKEIDKSLRKQLKNEGFEKIYKNKEAIPNGDYDYLIDLNLTKLNWHVPNFEKTQKTGAAAAAVGGVVGGALGGVIAGTIAGSKKVDVFGKGALKMKITDSDDKNTFNGEIKKEYKETMSQNECGTKRTRWYMTLKTARRLVRKTANKIVKIVEEEKKKEKSERIDKTKEMLESSSEKSAKGESGDKNKKENKSSSGRQSN